MAEAAYNDAQRPNLSAPHLSGPERGKRDERRGVSESCRIGREKMAGLETIRRPRHQNAAKRDGYKTFRKPGGLALVSGDR